ncbi:MAG: hypothetical protein AABW59_02400 [archaeon]
MDIWILISQWLIIFAINVIPAFAPPTWLVLSTFYIAEPQELLFLVFLGVTASTAGRYALAKGSWYVINKYGSMKRKKEMQFLKERLGELPLQKFFFTLIFALGPLPSNALFIAAGSAGIRLREMLAGFFVGRTLSYLALIFVSEKIFSSLELTAEGNATLMTLMIEIIGIIAIIAFFKFDWEKLLGKVETKERHKWPKINKHRKE